MPVYTLENIPTTTKWIKSLNASQAVDQCTAWKIPPGQTLEENRVILRKFVKEKNTAELQAENDDGDELEDRTDESLALNNTDVLPQTIQLPSTTTTTITTTTVLTPSCPPISTNSPTLVANQNPFGINQTQPQSILTDPNVQNLIQSLHSMTLNAVSQTAYTVAEQAKSFQPSKHIDETKCPPYVRDLLKELPKVTGDNQHETITFLKKLHRIIAMQLIKDKFIILNVLPYTTNRLREFWMLAIAQDFTWDQILKGIRENFFTVEDLRQLQNQYLYRHQLTHEHLADYVNDIKTLHTILYPQSTEAELFQTIFRGINPQTRTTFAGLKPINTITDLLEIAPLSASLVKLQSQHQFSTLSDSGNRFSTPQSQPQSASANNRSLGPNTPFRHQNAYRPNSNGPNRQYTTYQNRSQPNWRYGATANQFSPRPHYSNQQYHPQYPSPRQYHEGNHSGQPFSDRRRNGQPNHNYQANQPNRFRHDLNPPWGGR